PRKRKSKKRVESSKAKTSKKDESTSIAGLKKTATKPYAPYTEAAYEKAIEETAKKFGVSEKRSKHKHDGAGQKGDGSVKISQGTSKGLQVVSKGNTAKSFVTLTKEAQSGKPNLEEILEQKPKIYKDKFLPKTKSPVDKQLDFLDAEVDAFSLQSSTPSDSENIAHTYFPSSDNASNLEFMRNLEAHSSGAALHTSGTSEPSVQVKAQPDIPMLTRVLNTAAANISETSQPEQPQQQQPQPEKAINILPEITQSSPSTTSVPEKAGSDTIHMSPISSPTNTPAVNETVEVVTTTSVETTSFPEPEPKLKEPISSESSIP
ncbi:hypothetical protein A2U01_0001771, partial [Trifolium medium]|nr:hypothetical protein [Trifolium medium]